LSCALGYEHAILFIRLADSERRKQSLLRLRTFCG